MREILSGALGTFAFSVLMQVPRRLLFFTTFGGLLSGTVYRFAEENGMGAFGATLWGMLAVALYAELLARVLKTPSTVLLYPSTVPLLPGSAIYYAMQYLLWGQPDQAVAYAAQTLQIATGMGLGAVLVAVPIRLLRAHSRTKIMHPTGMDPGQGAFFYILFNGGYHLQSIRKTARQTPAAPPPHTGGTNRQTAAHGKWQCLAPAPRSPLW